MTPDGENYSDSDISEYSDFSAVWEALERRADAEARQSRNADREVRPQRGDAASHTRQRQTAGRHATQAHSAERRHSPPERITAAPPPQSGRRPVSRKRRRRKITIFLVLAVLLSAGFIAFNVVVSGVEGFQVASLTPDQQMLSWEANRRADGYDIYTGDGTLLAEIGADAGTQYVVTGLQGGTRYTYTIAAVRNFLGKHSGKAVECSAYTLPEAVNGLTATNSGTGALLSWENSSASGYEVQYIDVSGETKTVEAQTTDAEGLNIPDLQEGTQYTFQIRGFVQDGESRIYSEWRSAEPLLSIHTADMTGVDITKPMVALTFDDGPDYVDYTERILDILKEYGGHASFFQEGASAADLPEKITRIVNEGHQIACHTYDHSHYGTDVTAEDILKADDLIEQACGQRPSAFRSPGGMTTDLIREVCVSENMPIFYWSIDTEDWKSRDADAVCDVVMNNVSDGDIILMHNVYESTVQAVERIVPFLVDKGYQLVTVSQLVQAKTGNPPVPGVQYYTATETD